MKGLILLCGIALVSLVSVDAQTSTPIINCFVSPPNPNYPFLAPNPGNPPVIRAYNETGFPYKVCSQAYVSYNVPTNVTNTYSAYTGWLFGGAAEYPDVASCQTALTASLAQLTQQYGVFGSVIYYKASAVSCCQTEQCNDPSKVTNAASRQQPAFMVLLSALMSVVILRALWL